MELRQITAVYFSATGVTDKVVRTLAEALAESLSLPLRCRSFTRPAERAEALNFEAEELAVVGVPTYAGKTPNKLLPDLKAKLRGNGTPAVSVVTFGNRAFDNSLAELCAILGANGLRTVAAGAFPGRHAFTDALGEGRPDWEDRRKIQNFAKQIAAKLQGLPESFSPVEVPGDSGAPYYIPKGLDGDPVKFLKAKPQTDLGKCCNCGVCARACPMGAINPENVAEVPGTCIKCQACVRKCTHHAKYFDDPAFLSHVAMLEKNFQEPKDCSVFL
ncbi:MAG: 4Fe-4S binding protein [Oscillibacter sp.]|nr:4Fe-4S binding protein [Oscillibacter sp.]